MNPSEQLLDGLPFLVLIAALRPAVKCGYNAQCLQGKHRHRSSKPKTLSHKPSE
jgi:hypothetical protein